jgi:hypothetical protein
MIYTMSETKSFYQDILALQVGKTLYPKMSKENVPIKNLYTVQIDPNPEYVVFLEELINSGIKYPLYKTRTSNYYITFFKNGDMDMSNETQWFKFIERKGTDGRSFINAVLVNNTH